MRIATLVLCVLGAALWAVVARYTLVGEPDPAAMGLDRAIGWIVTALFLITAGPAFVLALKQARPRTALALALAFPVGFAALAAIGFFYFTYFL